MWLLSKIWRWRPAVLLKIDSSTFIFKGILYKVKLTLEILEFLGEAIFQKYLQQLRRAWLSK